MKASLTAKRWFFHLLLVIASTRAFEPHCPTNKDDSAGSYALWEEVPVGGSTWQKCPEGAEGNVTRECLPDSGSLTGARWSDPDVSSCINTQIYSFFIQSKEDLNGRSTTVQSAMDITNALRFVVEAALSNGTLYPADLISSSNLMADIARKVDSFGSIHEAIEQMTQEYCLTLSLLSDNKTHKSWGSFTNYDNVSQVIAYLLNATETFADRLLDTKRFCVGSDDVCRWNHVQVYTENIDFELLSLTDANISRSNITLMSEDGTTAFIFPEEIIKIMQEHKKSAKAFGFYRAEFKSLKPLLTFEPLLSPGNASVELEMNSHVAAAKILGVDSKYFANVTSPIVVILAHEGLPEEYHGNCYFMNTTATSQFGRWLDNGCEAVESNQTHTTCHCLHLTNFALLMDVFGLKLSKTDDVALTAFSYIGGLLSILGCLFSVIVYCYLRLSSERIKIHGMLATSIILSQVVFFAGFDRTDFQYACRAFAILLHYALTALFCWMLVEGVHLYISLVKVFPSGPHFSKYLIVGWGIPLVDVIISVSTALNHYGMEDKCWLSNTLLLYAFIPFVAVTIIVNTVILAVVLRVMVKSRQLAGRCTNDDVSAAKSSLKAAVVLLPLLGLTWIFGFLCTGTKATIIFSYLFTIFNSLQGVFFFVFHCLLNCEVQRAYEKRHLHSKATSACAANLRASPSHSALPDSEMQPGHENTTSKASAKKRASDISTESGETNTTGVSLEDHEKVADCDVIADYNPSMSKKSKGWANGTIAVTTEAPQVDFQDDESDNGYFEDPEIRDALWAMDSIFEDDVTPHIELYITHM